MGRNSCLESLHCFQSEQYGSRDRSIDADAQCKTGPLLPFTLSQSEVASKDKICCSVAFTPSTSDSLSVSVNGPLLYSVGSREVFRLHAITTDNQRESVVYRKPIVSKPPDGEDLSNICKFNLRILCYS